MSGIVYRGEKLLDSNYMNEMAKDSVEDKETFKNNCREFYKNVSENYPNSKIFAITPIWRKDCCEEREFGEFKMVEETIIKMREMDIKSHKQNF